MKKTKNFLTGFTLIEVLITLAIFVLVVSIAIGFYSLSQRFYQQGESRAELLQNGRIILERLTRDIRQAEEMVTPLPQTPDVPSSPPPEEIEFQDGHLPSPYAALGSDYYYIRYYLAAGTQEIHRQYRVYCFDDCGACSSYFRWNDSQLVDGVPVPAHPCDLEDRVVGEFVGQAEFWGSGIINIAISLQNRGEQIDLKTKVFGRNF